MSDYSLYRHHRLLAKEAESIRLIDEALDANDGARLAELAEQHIGQLINGYTRLRAIVESYERPNLDTWRRLVLNNPDHQKPEVWLSVEQELRRMGYEEQAIQQALAGIYSLHREQFPRHLTHHKLLRECLILLNPVAHAAQQVVPPHHQQ
jgi:hypothetical protein